MTTYVLGVGVGLFLIISLWTVAIALCIISLRTQKNLGLIVIVVAAVVTLILVLIPRESENPAPPVFKLYDHFFIWRTLIVIFLGLSALAGFVVVLVTHFMEPQLAQPIKEWKLCTSCLRERMASVGLMVSQLRCFAKTAIRHRGFFSQLMTNSVRALSCTCPSTKSFVINSNDDFEKKVMNSKDPVIVNFHADWCEPCKILTPRLEKLVSPLENVHLAVIDVEKNVELVHTFEVKAVPAVIAVRNGQVEDKFIGLVDADMIDNLINKLIKKPADSQQEN